MSMHGCVTKPCTICHPELLRAPAPTQLVGEDLLAMMLEIRREQDAARARHRDRLSEMREAVLAFTAGKMHKPWHDELRALLDGMVAS